jgi:hypothetical protein
VDEATRDDAHVGCRVNRAERRTIQRLLRDQTCGSCGGCVDELSHEAHLIGPSGERYGHLICASCFAEAQSGEAGQRAVARRAHLKLVPITEGYACSRAHRNAAVRFYGSVPVA